MQDPRWQQLAHTLVHYSLEVQPGEKVLVEAFDTPPAFTALLVQTIRQAGGLPLVSLRQNVVTRQLLKEASPEQLQLIGDIELYQMKKVDCYIGVRGADNANELSDVPSEKMRLYQQYWWQPVHIEERVRHKRWVVLRFPTPSMAQLAEMSTEGFENFYFRACGINYRRMAEAVLPLKKLMEQTDKVRITAPGTNLEFSIQGIPAVPCVGKRNIPDGEVFTAPVRNSAWGTIRFNTVSLYHGTPFEGIQLEFEEGRIVSASASHPQRLNEILDSDEGARYLGEFSLGLHPYILHPMRDTLFDEKIAGSLHLTPGNAYEEADNGNRSQIHWDLVLIQRPEYGGGEIYFDNVLIRKDGRFVLRELEGLNPENLALD